MVVVAPVGMPKSGCVFHRCTVRRCSPAAGGRLLFAATEDGSVRAYKLPLTPDFHAVRRLCCELTCNSHGALAAVVWDAC